MHACARTYTHMHPRTPARPHARTHTHTHTGQCCTACLHVCAHAACCCRLLTYALGGLDARPAVGRGTVPLEHAWRALTDGSRHCAARQAQPHALALCGNGIVRQWHCVALCGNGIVRHCSAMALCGNGIVRQWHCAALCGKAGTALCSLELSLSHQGNCL